MALARLRSFILRRPVVAALLGVGLYVVAATGAVLCLFPPYYSFWVTPVLLVTFPVSVFGFGIAFTSGITAESIIEILIAHVVAGMFYWVIVVGLLKMWAARANQGRAV